MPGKPYKYPWRQIPRALRREVQDRWDDMRVAPTFELMITDLCEMIAVIERYRRQIDPIVIEPDWDTPCIVCGMVPTVPSTRMCGPCTFGDSDTADGNW